MSMMKYSELLERIQKKEKDIVYDAKMGGVQVKIKKNRNKFTVLIDGEELDSYNSQRQAETMAKNFVKQYKR